MRKLLILLILPLCAFTIHDGDTITKISYRLAYIDAPELQQTCRSYDKILQIGVESRDYLESLQPDITHCKPITLDKYRRAVMNCDFNMQMVKAGHAVCYDDYLPLAKKGECYQAQDYAKNNNLGVWRCDNFMLPKDWRKLYRK